MYTTVDAIVSDIVSQYDNTDEDTYQNETKRTARIIHHLQRAGEALWFDRPWSFSMSSASLSMSSGSASLPATYGTLSPEGALYDANGRPWTEVTSYQDFIVARARGVFTARRYFHIGATVMVIDTNDSNTYTLIFQKVAPTMTGGGGTGFPQTFGEALLLKTVINLKAEENHDVGLWQQDFAMALARVRGLWKPGRSVTQQMPVHSPGMW